MFRLCSIPSRSYGEGSLPFNSLVICQYVSARDAEPSYVPQVLTHGPDILFFCAPEFRHGPSSRGDVDPFGRRLDPVSGRGGQLLICRPDGPEWRPMIRDDERF